MAVRGERCFSDALAKAFTSRGKQSHANQTKLDLLGKNYPKKQTLNEKTTDEWKKNTEVKNNKQEYSFSPV